MAIVGVSVGSLAAAGSPAAIAATGGGSGPTSAAQILGNVAAGNAVQGGGQALATSGSIGTQVNLSV